MPVRGTWSIALWVLLALGSCSKHDPDEVVPADQDIHRTDTLALVLGHYRGVREISTWSMPDNSYWSVDTVTLEVTLDTTLSFAVNLEGLESHMVINDDLSLAMEPPLGYGGGHGYLVLGDSIVVERSEGALAWNYSRSFKGKKID